MCSSTGSVSRNKHWRSDRLSNFRLSLSPHIFATNMSHLLFRTFRKSKMLSCRLAALTGASFAS